MARKRYHARGGFESNSPANSDMIHSSIIFSSSKRDTTISLHSTFWPDGFAPIILALCVPLNVRCHVIVSPDCVKSSTLRLGDQELLNEAVP